MSSQFLKQNKKVRCQKISSVIYIIARLKRNCVNANEDTGACLTMGGYANHSLGKLMLGCHLKGRKLHSLRKQIFRLQPLQLGRPQSLREPLNIQVAPCGGTRLLHLVTELCFHSK